MKYRRWEALSDRALWVTGSADSNLPDRRLFFHSDGDCQFASSAYRSNHLEHEVAESMSCAGDYDSAVESFFASLRKVDTHRRNFAMRTMACETMTNHTDGVYKTPRGRATNSFRVPMCAELRFARAVAA